MLKSLVKFCFAILMVAFGITFATENRQLNPRFQFFDIDLLKYVAEEKGGNVVVSPASVKSTLFMLLEGSEGDTRNELRRAMRLSSDKMEMREQLSAYMKTLQTRNASGVILENANGVFFSDKLKAKKAFEEVVSEVYGSELSSVNFTDPVKAADSVNAWVKNKTRALITELVEPLSISPTSSLLIVNALYFKGSWKKAFDPTLTRPRCFYKGDKCHNSNTMQYYGELKYAYIDELRTHAVELPYEGDLYSGILLVPHDRDGCESVVRDLSHVSLSRVTQLLEPTDIQLSVPRFSVDFTEDLAAALRQTKIRKLFSSAAELPGMIDGDSKGLRVDSIIQRVQLQVTEWGTVAAAATGALVVPLMGTNAVRLNVDRPFLFFIIDNASGALLFGGKIEEPEAAKTSSVDH